MPISSLRDPESFAPPPRRNPNAIGAAPSPTNSSSPASLTGPTIPHRPGSFQEASPDEPAPPPRPYRIDTTGLSTAHLPPPPARRDGADGRSPASAGAGRPGPPSLPPRLPPRSSSASTSPATPSPAPSPALPTRRTLPGPEQGYLNQSAITRLGAAGISVPGLGIGNGSTTSKAPPPPPPPARSPSHQSPSPSHMSELQSRFARLKPSSSPSPPAAETTTTTTTTNAAGGTTPAQKATALRTAAAFQRDPSSVSLSDARSAAATAHNFGERHGQQVASGLRAVGGLQARFGGGDATGADTGAATAAAAKKKPPPPPPPKKRFGLGVGVGQGQRGDEGEAPPPPVPMATRPTF
jgi:hypothetical protein